MLTDSQRAIVKSTVPLLESGGEALTTHFYRLLFSKYPQVRPLFNQAHQASGEQPRALANSVLQYARHIDNLAGLGNLPAQIINKHVSLQVEPAHYPLVGECLLQAIREVLGADIATDDVLAAWGAAYHQLADILIGAEEQVYAQTAAATGGWRGTRRFRITQKVAETPEITSFYLEPVDGGPVIAHQPGQYIGLRLEIDGQEVRRNYSLSAAANGRNLRISVKREADGLASLALHQRQVGDVLEVMPPAGEFTLAESDKPLVLLSGGVGVTPLMAMLQAALATERPIHFIHCAPNRAAHAFRDDLEALAAAAPQLKCYYCYEQVAPDDGAHGKGLLNTAQLAQWLPSQADFDAYFVGPAPFMRAMRHSLRELGVPDTQTRYEFFGPAQALD